MPKIKPYESALELLDDECRFLRVRAARIEIEKEHRTAEFALASGADVRVGTGSLKHRVEALRGAEEELRTEIDARRQVTNPAVGLDRIVHAHDLDEHERILVAAVCIPVISTHLAEEVFAGTGFYLGSPTTEDLVRMIAPSTVGEWVATNDLLSPNSTLVIEGILAVDCTVTDSPAHDWRDARVYPSAKTLAIVLGRELPVRVPSNGTAH